VAGASDTLDPIAAAEAGIAGSKHLIASVANDLSQQERWLAHYRLAEKRRARRAKFRELIYRFELRRRRLARWLRRMALIALRLARSAAAFLSRTAIALFVMVRDAATAGYLWARPLVYAGALTLAAWTLAGLAWALVETRRLARAAGNAAAISAAWVAREARLLGAILWRWLAAAWAWTTIVATRLARAAATGASIAATWSVARAQACAAVLQRAAVRFAAWSAAQAQALATSLRRETVRFVAWSAAQARAFTTSLRRETIRLAAWTRRKTGHFSRASLATASLGFSWSKPAGQPADASRRALTIRRCTALISFEPRRAHLPAISGPAAPPSVSSNAVHAVP
jgi:hypothetical protein